MVQNKVSRRKISGFYQNILRWESVLLFASNELLFLDTLLHSKFFENAKQTKAEEMHRFKLEIKTKITQINQLTTQVALSRNIVGAFLECDETSSIEVVIEDYLKLKLGFTIFNDSYNNYKTEIFNHTGGVL